MTQKNERSILFVDDEPYVLEAIKRSIGNQGYSISTATDVRTAIQMLHAQPFAIVVSDYDMPDMLGPAFLEEVKKIQPSAIRVVLTGASDLRVIQSFIHQGQAMRYLLKPWDIVELKNTLQECFELYSEAA